MNDSGMNINSIDSVPEARDFLAQFGKTASNEAVYGQPIQQGEYTVITASEVALVGGVGYGSGHESRPDAGQSSGGGGGGGGVAAGRPVAAIIIGPDGVKVEPIVDPTKIAITFFSAIITVFVTIRQLTRRK